MIRATLYILAAALLFAGAEAWAGVRVRLHGTAEVPGSFVRLLDIATVDEVADDAVRSRLEGVFLGHSPEEGESRTIHRLRVRAQLLAHGFRETAFDLDGAESVRIVRAIGETSPGAGEADRQAYSAIDRVPGNEPDAATTGTACTSRPSEPADRLSEAIKALTVDYVRAHLGVEKARVQSEVLRSEAPEDALSRAAAVRLETPSTGSPLGTGRLRFGLYRSDGTHVESFDAVVRTSARVPAVVPLRKIRRGERLVADALREGVVELRPGQDVYASAEEVVGKRSTRTLSAGRPIRRGSVRVPPLVKRGQTVVVEAQIGAMRITSRGRAMEEGVAGEVVPVRNADSGKVFPARVEGDGTLTLVRGR
jgi:flagella basal body P-ring formation protein FlgA